MFHLGFTLYKQRLIKARPSLVFLTEVQRHAVDCIAVSFGGTWIAAPQSGPEDADLWVVPGDAALVVWVIEVIALVAELSRIGEDKEAVSEAAGDQELSVILGA